MHALQPLESPEFQPQQKHRPRHRRRSENQHKALMGEIAVKIIVNLVLSGVAISALVKLLPHHFLQQDKLQEVRSEVKETEVRVERLRDNFSRNFDPSQTKKVMQEQSPRIDPNQRRIFWLH
jgi:uncharacterized membrane protein (DUF106 family)